MKCNPLNILGFSIALAVATGSPADAQAPPAAKQSAQGPAAPAPTVPADPQATTAAFGDWVVKCQRLGEAGKAQRVCEAAQSIQAQNQGLIAQIAFGRTAKSEPLKITVLLPSNIAFPSAPKISIDDKDTKGVDLVWRRCIPGGCMADAPADAETLTRWRTQTERGRIAFKDAGGRDAVIPFSFRGLVQALDALAKE